MPDLTPEQRARETIDAMLVASGWRVQTKDAVTSVYRLALEQEPVLEPFAESVAARSDRCLAGKAYQRFGNQLPRLLDELNEVLAA